MTVDVGHRLSILHTVLQAKKYRVVFFLAVLKMSTGTHPTSDQKLPPDRSGIRSPPTGNQSVWGPGPVDLWSLGLAASQPGEYGGHFVPGDFDELEVTGNIAGWISHERTYHWYRKLQGRMLDRVNNKK